MWTGGLAAWYREHGRHDLPWRQTRDPWAILVSEVMLQQTQVARVIPYWEAFTARWPTADACAAASLADVLRLWRGLGYPRRARDLWRSAAIITERGWPRDEAAMRVLPGVGPYTARALLVLAPGVDAPLPLDVNIRRVAARAALGIESADAQPGRLDAVIAAGRPRRMDRRHYTYALFDAGALHCRATPRCNGCPVSAGCRSRTRFVVAAPGARASQAPRKQQVYRGSMRELRGRVLEALLDADPPESVTALRATVIAAPAACRPDALRQALDSLTADGLVDAARVDALEAHV